MADGRRGRSLNYEAIVEKVRAQLLRGEIGPGDRLATIAEMAHDWNVSQGVVREAYRVLERAGLLQIVQGRGTFVAPEVNPLGDVLEALQAQGSPTRAQLLEARRLLEPQVAALAASRATTPERRAILRAALQEAGPDAGEPAWARYNMTFHGLIALAAHNPVVSQILTRVYEFFEKAEPHPAEKEIVRDKARHFHRLIAYAIDEGDAAWAETLMREHIGAVEKIVAAPKATTEVEQAGSQERRSRVRGHADEEL